jgi:dTDP-4-amino-4,6-dideoxygalactose transaminase
MDEKIFITKSSLPSLEEYMKEIEPIFKTAWMTNMGPIHKRLEAELRNKLKVENISLFVNGHLALLIALKALRLTGEVITTPFSFASTTHAIMDVGLNPVFCDIDPVSYTMDTKKIEALITPRTTAILPVHVYGNVCNIYEMEELAHKYKLKVIYDAAHAFGVTVNGDGIGCFGDISMFSFHATKVFNTIEGGALTYKDPSLRERLDNLKNFGITSPVDVEDIGTNAKMNEFQAAMGICNLRHLADGVNRRKVIYDYYQERLGDIKGLQLNRAQKGIESNYAYFPVLFDAAVFGRNRDQVAADLAKENIFARKYFYPLINDYKCYRALYSSAATPVAKRIAGQVLTLPLFPDLDLAVVSKICDIILQV